MLTYETGGIILNRQMQVTEYNDEKHDNNKNNK